MPKNTQESQQIQLNKSLEEFSQKPVESQSTNEKDKELEDLELDLDNLNVDDTADVGVRILRKCFLI